MYSFEYFVKRSDKDWGSVREDDKYYHEHHLMDNFYVFYVYAFAHLNLPAPTHPQLEMARFISDTSNPHRMVMAMRGLSKSLTSQIYVVWRLLNDPNEHILVMSAGSKRAVNYTQFVRKLIALLPVTKPMTPRHNMERTSAQAFDVAGAIASDSPSLYAVGVGNQITGMRATLVVYDDIETPQTVESLVMTEKIDVFAMEAQNLLMSGKDESLTLCTPHSMSSIYLGWVRNGVKCFIIPAQYPSKRQADNYFDSLAPFVANAVAKDSSLVGKAVDKRLNLAFLTSKKMRIGKSKYKLQYSIDVSESDDLRYPLKLSDMMVMDVQVDEAPLKLLYSSMPDNQIYIRHKGFRADKFFTPSFASKEATKYELKILFIDPSGRGQDKTSLSLIYSLNTRLFVKSVTGLQGGYQDENMLHIANMCDAYEVDILVVEDNYGDGMFLKILEPFMRDISPNTAIDELHVTGQKEIRIIEALEPALNQHKLVFDKQFLEADYKVETVHSFTYQFTHLTKVRECLPHDDLIDGFASGVLYMIDKMGDNESKGLEKYADEALEKELETIFSAYDQLMGGAITQSVLDSF